MKTVNPISRKVITTKPNKVLMSVNSYGYNATRKQTTGYSSFKAYLNHQISKAPKITVFAVSGKKVK